MKYFFKDYVGLEPWAGLGTLGKRKAIRKSLLQLGKRLCNHTENSRRNGKERPNGKSILSVLSAT